MYDRISCLIISDFNTTKNRRSVDDEHFVRICVADILFFYLLYFRIQKSVDSLLPSEEDNYFCATHNLRNIQGGRALNISLAEINFCAPHEDGDVPAFKIF